MEPKVLIDRKRRTLYIIGDVSARMATQFRKLFNSLANTTEQITVEINTQGGECEGGQAIADTIHAYGPGVVTVAAGYAMSMGAIILAAGNTRKALRSTVIMIHEGKSTIPYKKDSDLEAEFVECKRLQNLMWERLDEYTGKTAGYWRTRAGSPNLYLNADQAKAEGLIHEVIQ